MIRKVKYKKGIFIQLLLLPLLAVLIVGTGSYVIYMGEMGKRLNISLEAAAEQLENRIDNVIYNVSKIYLEAADNAAVKNLSGQDAMDIFYVGLKDTLSELQGPYYLSDYISGYSLVNVRYGWVLSNRGLYSLDQAINREEIEALFEEASSLHSQSSFWKNQIDDTSANDNVNRLEVNLRGLCRVVKVPLLARKCDTLLIVNIDLKQLARLVSQGTGEYGMTVYDDRGELVYTNQPEMGEYYKNNVDIPQSGLITVEDGSRFRLAVISSNLSGWTYIASYDRAIVSDGGRGILLLAVLVIAVLLVEFILAHKGAEQIYSPVKQLMNYALDFENGTPCLKDVSESSAEKQEKQNEFAYISKTMKRLAANNADLEEMIETQRIHLQELFVRRILNGEIQADAILSRAEQLGLRPGRYLYVIATAVRPQKEDMEGLISEDTQRDVLSLNILNNMPEELTGDLLIGPFWDGTVIFSLLSTDEEEEAQERVLEFQHGIALHAQASGDIKVYSGASNLFLELTCLKRAYDESLEALKNNELLKKDTGDEREDKYDLVFFSDFTARFRNALHYDLNYETQIKEAVTDCDEQKAGTITDEFVDSLIENKVILQERTLALYKYMIAVLSVAGQAGMSANEIFDSRDRDLFATLNSIYEWDMVRHFYKKKVIHPVIEKLKGYMEGMVDSVLNKVICLVKEKQGNITLGECADSLGHHPSYIWKIMTSRMNVTFSEYLASYKLELAKKMLLETDMTVAEIAEKLNYTSAQNFNRFFTKYENISPGKYRKMNKG